MKKTCFDLNMALSVKLNIIRLYRWINQHLSKSQRLKVKSGDRRYRMAFAANTRRMAQDRRFKFNGFRNPRGKRPR